MRPILRSALSAVLASTLGSSLLANEIITSFEFSDLSGSFTIGAPPKSATFANGIAASVGVLSLYHSGQNAWMITAGQTGTVSFETPADQVELWVIDEIASSPSILTAHDTGSGFLATINVTTTFQKITFDATALGANIGSIKLQNNGANGLSAIDDFTYCAAVGAPITDPIPGPIPASNVPVQLVPIADGLIAPNWGIAAPIGDRLYVTDQPGVLYAIDVETGEKTVFLDVSAQLVSLCIGGPNSFDERGLLGVAFHPDYASNGLLYTYTSEPVVGVADFPAPPGRRRRSPRGDHGVEGPEPDRGAEHRRLLDARRPEQRARAVPRRRAAVQP